MSLSLKTLILEKKRCFSFLFLTLFNGFSLVETTVQTSVYQQRFISTYCVLDLELKCSNFCATQCAGNLGAGDLLYNLDPGDVVA